MEENKVEAKTIFGEIEEIEDAVEKRFKRFKKFDILGCAPYDHHFLACKKLTRQIDVQSNLAKRIMKEWEVLEARLPSTTLVRVYKERVDLMRAVIQGPQVTPYHQGLFFFDICIPSNYPVKPPDIFYHSYGFDLNPNLHKDGKVSLNLLNLNHWYQCHKEQKWNPNQSNLLQVLISIQHLVLNSKPYFAESLRMYIFNEELSKKYKKETFMQTCEAMLYTLKKPPRHFEDFVAGYFRKQAHSILMNYKARMSTDKVMNQLFCKLLRAFEANGAYCGHHHHAMLKEEVSSEENYLINGSAMNTTLKVANNVKNLWTY